MPGVMSALYNMGRKGLTWITLADSANKMMSGAAHLPNGRLAAMTWGLASLAGLGPISSVAAAGAVGIPPVRKTIAALSSGVASMAMRRPGTVTAISGILGGSIAAAVGLTRTSMHLPRPRGVGPSQWGHGYVSWSSGRAGGMSPNHLGASGGLALALHNTRHRINSRNVGL